MDFTPNNLEVSLPTTSIPTSVYNPEIRVGDVVYFTLNSKICGKVTKITTDPSKNPLAGERVLVNWVSKPKIEGIASDGSTHPGYLKRLDILLQKEKDKLSLLDTLVTTCRNL